MAILHVKSPNGVQTAVDTEKLLLTGPAQTLLPGAKFISGNNNTESVMYLADPNVYDPVPFIAYRNLINKPGSASEESGNYLAVGFDYDPSTDENPGASIKLFDETNQEASGAYDYIKALQGVFEVFASAGTEWWTLRGFPDGKLFWAPNNSWDTKYRLDYDTGTGYIRWGNGFRICWGQATTSATGATITFPVPETGTMFTSTPTVIMSTRGGGTNPATMYSPHLKSVNSTQFVAIGIRLSGGTTITAGNYSFDWIAYGVGGEL